MKWRVHDLLSELQTSVDSALAGSALSLVTDATVVDGSVSEFSVDFQFGLDLPGASADLDLGRGASVLGIAIQRATRRFRAPAFGERCSPS